MQLEVVEGDITALDVDAIANPANDQLLMGGGVAGAIKRAGGDDIERDALAQAPIALGEAVATHAGALPARHVVHAAVMKLDFRTDAEIIRAATARTLEVADEVGALTLALPAFGTGVGRFPMDESARLMVAAAQAHDPRTLERVVFVARDAEARRAFEAALGLP
jgi:O-acetyl-ADP-ribose deacetylase (regulator of RNase III)